MSNAVSVERNNQLIAVRNNILKINGFIKVVCGDMTSPLPIKDESDLNTVVENITSLKRLKQTVEEVFRPIKEEAKIPWQKALDDEKAWLNSIEKVFKFADERVKEFNARKKEELRIKQQAEADARAEQERQRLEDLKKQAEAAGNTEAVQAIEETKKDVIAAPVAEKMMKHKGDDGTMTENWTIEDFKINNHESLAGFLLGTGKGHMIFLDKKTETAIKKWLLANPGIKEIDGCEFRRDIKTNYR